jgi:putative Holliday junction resolvase
LPGNKDQDAADAARTRTPGRLLALDIGTKRVGVAVSDELGLTARPLPALSRTNWKKLLRDVSELCGQFDVKGVVVGLPLRLDGVEGDAAEEARRLARNFGLSLARPVFLQDERLTSKEAESELRRAGHAEGEVRGLVDSQAAVIILRDYLSHTPGFTDET